MGQTTDARAPRGGRTRNQLSRSTLEAVRRRDSNALGALFDAYFDRLFGFAYRLLGDHSAAQAAHQIDPDRDPGPWLMTVAHNACREYWRKRGRKVEGHSQSLDSDTALRETIANGRADPERTTLSSQREALIQRALMGRGRPIWRSSM